MAVKYRLFQDNRKDSVHNGQWYARTVYGNGDVMETDDLCELIQNATTLHKADVRACVEAFLDFIRRGLLDGKRVKLDRFGTFKVGIHTSPANSVKKFNVAENIKGAHVIFSPMAHVDRSGGYTRIVKSLISGVKFREQSFYDVNPPKGKGSNENNG